MELLFFILKAIIIFISISSLIGVYALKSEVFKYSNYAGKLNFTNVKEKEFVRNIFESTGISLAIRNLCNVTESGVYSNYSREELEKLVVKKRTRTTQILSLILCLPTLLYLEAVIATIVLFVSLFLISTMDSSLVRLATLNTELVIDQ